MSPERRQTGDAMKAQVKGVQRQLLTVLVMDLGYTHPPVHRRDPIRHQYAWALAVDDWTPEDITAEVDACRMSLAAAAPSERRKRDRRVVDREMRKR